MSRYTPLSLVVLLLLLAACDPARFLPDPEAPMTGSNEAIPVTVLPLNPQSYEGLRSYTRILTFIVDAKKPPPKPGMQEGTIGFDVHAESSIHYDRREAELRWDDRGHRPLRLDANPSHHTVLFGASNVDRTYRTYPDAPERCIDREWRPEESRFDEEFGSVDIVDYLKPYHLLTDDNRMTLIPLGPAEVNGIPADHYRLDPAASVAGMKRQYPDFDGTASAEVYLAAGGNALLKGDFLIEGASLPAIGLPFTSGYMEGRIELTFEASNLNDAPPVTLQPQCADKPAP